MKVSVIIPVYKVEASIERCLKSVVSQNFSGSLECVVVDDASPDASMEHVHAFIRSCGSQVEWRVMTHESNKGLSEARNTGIAAATGEYLYFLDSDDEMAADALHNLTSLAEKYPDVDIVQGNIAVCPASDGLDFDIARRHFPEYTDNIRWIREKMMEEIPVMAWNKLIRCEWVRHYGFLFKEGILHEDEHWRYQVFDKVRSIAFCNDVTYIYHMNELSITHSIYKDRSAGSMLEIYKEFFDKIPSSNHWLHIFRVLCTYTINEGVLEHPENFLPEFKQLVENVIRKKHLPQKVRIAYGYILRPSKYKLLYLRLFHHSTYGILRRYLDGFRSPFARE